MECERRVKELNWSKDFQVKGAAFVCYYSCIMYCALS